jgi:hypothetical protein
VMSSPLFYLLALVIGGIVDRLRARRQRQVALGVIVLQYIPMSFEGVTPQLSFSRDESVTVERVVLADAASVAAALAKSPDISRPLPAFLRAGFPVPTHVSGEGLKLGDTRRIHFAGGEGHPGDLELLVSDVIPGRVTFIALTDHSKIAHWLEWKSATIEWKAIDGHHTQVSWTLRYRRDLDPSWYFGPWERYAVSLAAEYLIESNATPKVARP